MKKRTTTAKRGVRAGPFAAGVLIGLSIVGPVFAASDVWFQDWTAGRFQDWTTWLLAASVLLLLMGLVLKAISVSRARKSGPAATGLEGESVPDMRRDRLAPSAVDHSLSLGAIPRRQLH